MPEENKVNNVNGVIVNDVNEVEDVEEMVEELTKEELHYIVNALKNLKTKKIYLKEFIGNEGSVVNYLYIPMACDSSLHGLKVPFGVLKIKEYTVTKVTKLGLSLADNGKEITGFSNDDIQFNG